ncbi:hypothetical protein GCM10010387_26030 [Streptomyces inusitatus]|uniref:Uncharacterized protein n=1 Tax=Streptomyces inusitatus TaxID=68221 RepID=A0A918US10_9ACTN|nr:hypothetical protein [Streptomyces inusitatus]GGZ31064.1 hypothetical protein GCM10010387_26030 [Streptomyces inusitatus]
MTSVPTWRAHPVRAELLRGSAPWAGAAVLVVLAVPLILTAHEWQGGWAQTQALLRSVLTQLAAPLAVAAGCWQGQREHRRGTRELLRSAPRTRLARTLTAALPTAIWTSGAALAASAGALLACWPYTSAGGPVFSAVFADAGTVGALSLFGHVAGAVLRWRLTAPVLALCTPFAELLPVMSLWPIPDRPLSPAPATPMLQTSIPVWWQPLATIVWVGGLGAAAILLYAARRRVYGLLPLAAALVAATVLVQGSEHAWRPDPLALRLACDDTVRPEICVSGAHPGMLPEVRKALSGLTARLEGVENTHVRLVDIHQRMMQAHVTTQGGTHIPERDPDVLTMRSVALVGQDVIRGRLTDPEQFAWDTAQSLTGEAIWCEARRKDMEVHRIDRAVTEFLAPNPAGAAGQDWSGLGSPSARDGGEPGDREALAAVLDRLRAMGDEERRRWLSEYFASARGCESTRVPAL